MRNLQYEARFMMLRLPIQGDGFLLREFATADALPLAAIEFDPAVKKYLAIPNRNKRRRTGSSLGQALPFAFPTHAGRLKKLLGPAHK